MTFDECVVTLSTKTGLSRDEWADFLSLPPEAQCAAAAAYRGASWVQSRDTLADVMSALLAAAQVAGAIAGIGSGYTALKAL